MGWGQNREELGRKEGGSGLPVSQSHLQSPSPLLHGSTRICSLSPAGKGEQGQEGVDPGGEGHLGGWMGGQVWEADGSRRSTNVGLHIPAPLILPHSGRCGFPRARDAYPTGPCQTHPWPFRGLFRKHRSRRVSHACPPCPPSRGPPIGSAAGSNWCHHQFLPDWEAGTGWQTPVRGSGGWGGRWRAWKPRCALPTPSPCTSLGIAGPAAGGGGFPCVPPDMTLSTANATSKRSLFCANTPQNPKPPHGP